MTIIQSIWIVLLVCAGTMTIIQSIWIVLLVCECTMTIIQNTQIVLLVCAGTMAIMQSNNNINNNSYIALYPVKLYKLAVLHILNIKIRLTIKKVQVL